MKRLDLQKCIVGSVFTNCYFLKNKETEEMLIVDPGDNADRIEQKVLEMQGRPVAILLTHGHFDHILAAEEIKKKYKRVVYKRRTEMSENESMRYLCNGEHIDDSQILREVNYFLEHYKGIAPQVVISYNREAFYSKNDYDFRVTFDDNILWRNYDLSLCKGIYGTPILRNDYSLMEIKTGTAIPLWMTNILSENKIYKTSFSKYGNAYVAIMSERANGGKKYA